MIETAYLPRKLPEEIRELVDLATDLRWTWSHESDSLWHTLDPETWEKTQNPYVVLQNLSENVLYKLADDTEFKVKLEKLKNLRRDYLAQPGWFGECYSPTDLRNVAYFSMEFGLGETLPLYAGGLGILAGDTLKAASDLGVPVTGVGLLYQEGYFRQILDTDGWQQEAYPFNDPTILPVFPVAASSGAWLIIEVELAGRRVRCRVWRARVGRVNLYLLDSNDPLNNPVDRGITGKLYGGGEEMRLAQEIILGLGGWRLINALELPIDVCHLNEGHAAFVTLERARQVMEKQEIGFHEALWMTRPGNLFTTHTPVSAGFDSYGIDLLERYGSAYAERLGLTLEELAGLGRPQRDDAGSPFNMAFLAARTCGRINGVSRLHSVVSRRIFQPLFPHMPQADVPISYVTNGVHTPTWDSASADILWTEACGKERWRTEPEHMAEAMAAVTDAQLWKLKADERSALIDFARHRLADHYRQRGENPEKVSAAHNVLNPEILTLGFGRRFATYKRPNLLLKDPERLIRLLSDPQKPVQILIAGKAHPKDEEGKRLIQEWVHFVQRPEVRQRAVFLEDYDMALAQQLVQGVDLWINMPRRPWEACGTSGMKVLVNGGLNLSTLDGWWDEAYAPEVGWALGERIEHGADRDAADAEALYALLEEEIVPLFYARDRIGIPRQWVAHMRSSLAQLTSRFSASRMMRDYVEKLYLPASTDAHFRNDIGTVQELCSWEQALRHDWDQIQWGQRTISKKGGRSCVEVDIDLGRLPTDGIRVELYADDAKGEGPKRIRMSQKGPAKMLSKGTSYSCLIDDERPARDYTARILPHHPLATLPIELNLISWEPRT